MADPGLFHIDQEADALYIHLNESPVFESEEVAPGSSWISIRVADSNGHRGKKLTSPKELRTIILMNYHNYITLEPGKRSGKPCIRGLRITVYDVLGYLAAGLTPEKIISDFPEITHDDIMACLAFAADPHHSLVLQAS